MKFDTCFQQVSKEMLIEVTLRRNILKSSWLTSMEWTPNEDIDVNEITNETLGKLTFTTNRSATKYEFPDVPYYMFVKWKNARSYGKFFHKKLKGQY